MLKLLAGPTVWNLVDRIHLLTSYLVYGIEEVTGLNLSQFESFILSSFISASLNCSSDFRDSN